MQVHKFGGASLKDAESIKKLPKLLRLEDVDAKFLVVSAMGKTTNQLEEALHGVLSGTDPSQTLKGLVAYHQEIIEGLFMENKPKIQAEIQLLIEKLEVELAQASSMSYDEAYDRVVSYGELMSSLIVSKYLSLHGGIDNDLLDSLDFIRTSDRFRKAELDWNSTRNSLTKVAKKNNKLLVIQGFTGGTSDGRRTTLGREGSDYTAAIIASCIGADSVTIWKDVSGVMSADPKLFKDAVKYEYLDYYEAVEMSFFGATIIHPKTLKPLQNANIQLIVRSFIDPEQSTVIHSLEKSKITVPNIIIKPNQALISISSKELDFISEKQLSDIFSSFYKHKTTINLMQTGAVSFSVCCTEEEQHFSQLIEELSSKYTVRFNTGLHLLTIRHYQSSNDELLKNKEILLEQKSRNTIQWVIKDQLR